MSDAGIFTLTKALMGGISAVLTGPAGTIQLPDADLRNALTTDRPAIYAQLTGEDGRAMGYLDETAGGAPLRVVSDMFLDGLIATEDVRFSAHPGVDPFAVGSAILSTVAGNPRGGSSIPQQSVKNAVTGNARTLERKIVEGILATRAVASLPRARILEGYLANAQFGRGARGAGGASMNRLGLPWGKADPADTAMLIGLLKGPARYDPLDNPDAARERRDTVLQRMMFEGVISPETAAAGSAAELLAPADIDRPGKWVSRATRRDLDRLDLPQSDRTGLTLTLRDEWQEIAQKALLEGVSRVAGVGPAGRIDIGDRDPKNIRDALSRVLTTTSRTGRALVTGHDDAGRVTVLLDRGYGPLVESAAPRPETDARAGDVFAYRRSEDGVRLVDAPRANGAVVVMEARTGAILASVGGATPESSGFDRTEAKRQPGSAIKPFLWARVLEEGLVYDEMVSDTRGRYTTPSGETWSPRNYDGSETGYIPLFVALEESSNQVAARLVDLVGTGAMANITELAGVYPPNGMRRHPSSALGASETTVTRLAGGYAAIANGGISVTPHVISRMDGTVVSPEPGPAVMTRRTAGLIRSMMYGVTKRGTAARVFGPEPVMAGKTGTTQDHRDAWFVGITPDIVIAVWVGRDDNRPLPDGTTGSQAAAPIAKRIVSRIHEAGLTPAPGRLTESGNWPPDLLVARAAGERRYTRDGSIVRGSNRARRASPGDPFKNQSDLIGDIRRELGPGASGGTDPARREGRPDRRDPNRPDWAEPARQEGGYLETETDPLGEILR